MPEIVASLLPAQLEFLNAPEHEVLYSGAFGAGKSRALCYKLLKHAVVPGNFVGLCRKTFAELRQTTLRTLLENDGKLPPVLPVGTYTHNRTEHLIRLNGGGQIYYFGFDDPERMGSLNFGAVGIDEGIELQEDEYNMLLGRTRSTAAAALQIFTATNPGGPTHYLFRRFHIGDPGGRPSDRRVVHTRSADNFYLPHEYIRVLDGFSGAYRDRYVEGKWGAFEGMVYSGFDVRLHVKTTPKPLGFNYAGIDDGFTNAFCVVVGVQRHNSAIHICEESYESGLLEPQKVQRCLDLARRHGIQTFYVDPSAAGLIASLRNAGLNAVPADNDVLAGIGRVQKRMSLPTDCEPTLTMEPVCKHLVEELQSYSWQAGKDAPVKTGDHAPDALRYLVSGLDGGTQVDMFWPGAERDEPEPDVTIPTGEELNRTELMFSDVGWSE